MRSVWADACQYFCFHLFIRSEIITVSRCDSDQEFPALVLAAGVSSRFGQPKALLTLRDKSGQSCTLLDHAIGQGKLLSRDVRVVCGAWYPLVRFRCRLQPSRWVPVADWREGMAASLTAGIRSLGPCARGVFVLVADQPLLDTEALGAFGEAARCFPAQPVAADYGRHPGVPAYLPRGLWPEVLALKGDRGAGRLLSKAGATRVNIPGVHDDIDTPEDWERVRQAVSRKNLRTRQSQG